MTRRSSVRENSLAPALHAPFVAQGVLGGGHPDLLRVADLVRPMLASLPRTLDGVDAVRYLLAQGTKAGGNGRGNALQMEWPGWFGQTWLADQFQAISSDVRLGHLRYENTVFDHHLIESGRQMDSKVHVGSGPIPLNDAAAMRMAVGRDGALYLLVVHGGAEYCTTGKFRAWQYAECGAVAEGLQGRARKVRVQFHGAVLVKIDAAGLARLDLFRQGRNSNTKGRPVKYKATMRRLLMEPHVVLWGPGAPEA